jgi:uncharacterized protein HemY
VLQGQRRYLESKESLEKAAAAWPQDRRIREAQARLLFAGREYAAAREVLEDLRKQGPPSPELSLLLGQTWLESKEPAKAIPLLEEVVKRNPKLAKAQGALGRAYLDAGEAKRAIPPLEAALADDEDGSLHFQLARAYRTTGRAEDAGRMMQTFEEIRRANEAGAEQDKEAFAITEP